MASLVDLYSGYDQQTLYQSSKDFTAFFTPLGLFRCTTLPQGAINSVAQFVRTVNLILRPLQLKVFMLFVDDIRVKRSQTDYFDEEALSGIRRFGGYIGQRETTFGKVQPARYESGAWTEAERNYDAIKRECRELAWINLFDFKVRYVFGKDHTAADVLSRRLRHSNDLNEEDENEFDNSLLADLRLIKARDGSKEPSTDLLVDIR
ncbi:gag-pol polyprotein [Drepanopeziza brunnea f. sp. 'multigermtubi' MB_m1]|uniref:Gag-pol polyprotein n=1 Tax=Marssonina brunnea f. sp. multigermtubi (strain MB_m1) TaxID=1072389 RepID=K1XI94_MARBU|nr:gag-pol polyprotein [Drepanopeziza brunnea f. sp. 'multigermtubi' MB_m1]EKD12134.1 gag-pol polyprotein [Drepanopeziza brunnea f. sp. 'multigermtubi' MB_m1]